jgi:large subunit ribosomal protein L32e
MEIKKLLEIRKRIKKNKPTFVVKESNFSSRVKRRWRFPRGMHSKVRQMHRGRPKLVSPGYGSPKSVANLHHSGLQQILIKNKKELLKVDNKLQGAIIAREVGNKKRLELLQLAEEKEIRVLNVKDTTKLIGKINERFAERKKVKEERGKHKSKKEAEKKKKAEEKKKKEEQEKTEDKKDNVEKAEEVKEEQNKEKAEMEKTLIKKQ